MLVSEYAGFVAKSDQYADRPAKERQDISLYGLVSELGSVVAAIKKQILSEGGDASWDHSNEEIIEELGDVVWYCFSLVSIVNSRPINIFRRDVRALIDGMAKTDSKSRKIQAALTVERKDQFLRACPS
jgi:NTP pyrophosphatase (non-canonical NTP hydrolase)